MAKIVVLGGLPKSLINFRGHLLRVLVDKGHQVHASSSLADADLVAALDAMGVQHHPVSLTRTSLNPIQDLATIWQLVVLLRKVRPDYLLSYTVKPVIYGTLAAWITRVPFRFALITGLGYPFQEEGRRLVLRFLVQRLYALALRRAHKVFFQNPDDERLFRNLSLLPARIPSWVVNGSGVDVAAFKHVPLPSGARFLLIARLLGEKGVRVYVEAARLIRARHPEVVFGMVGWIDENPGSIGQQELDAWIAEGAIQFYGRLADVRPAIADCSIYVLPSYYREGTPRTVLEAMAMGRAVITTDAPGCRETVVNGENGFLVPVRSVAALEAAMQRFIDEPGLIAQMGRRSREIAEKKYDVRKVNAVMLREMGID